MNTTRFNRRLILTLPLALMACGFTPAYGPNGAAKGMQTSIRIADPADKNGFDLVERLEERIGRPQAERFKLGYAITTSTAGVGITPDNATTRYNINGSINWTLNDLATGAQVAGGTVNSFTSYSATGSTVAGLSAQEDAARRLMRILADQIVTRLLASSGAWNK